MAVSTGTQMVGPWVVLNCAVTQVLGHYADEQTAAKAATEFGNCSFPYELSAAESQAMSTTAR